MSDISAKQTVQGGSILDALSKLLFKGLDHIFDAASEYQKEMGVLKQVTKIPVQNPIDTSEKYDLVVKLVPIKDKDSIYYVEVECPGYSKFKPGTLHQSTIKLNKDNLKDFYKTVDELLKKNDLERIETNESEADSDQPKNKKSVNKYTDVYEFLFHTYDEDTTDYDVDVNVESSTSYDETTVRVTSDPELPSEFVKTISFKNKSDSTKNLGDKLDAHMKQVCRLCVDDSDKQEWQDFIAWLNDISNKNPDDFEESDQTESTDDQQETAASIRVVLEKVIGSDNHEDINLVSINASGCTEEHAIDVITYIVGSDEFVDQMPVGESSYIITDEDDDYDITQC